MNTAPDWGTAADLDPATVPVFPVVRVEVAGQTVSVDNHTVHVGDGRTAERAAIDTAAEHIRSMPGNRAAVRAIIALDGQEHRIIVTRDGEAIPVGPTRPSRPAWMWPAVVGTVLVLVIVVGTGVVLSTRRPGPSSTAAPLPSASVLAATGAGANLPLPAPPGFAQRATWSVPIDRATAPVVAGASILALTKEHDLVLLDPATGQPYWQASHTPAGVVGIHLTHVDGQLVAATSTNQTLTYWPLPSPTSAMSSGPILGDSIEVDLPEQGTVVWAPTSPVVHMPDQTAAVIHDGQAVTLDVPVGAVAVDADGTTVLAIDPVAGRWWHLAPGKAFGNPGTLDRPGGGVGNLMRAVAVDTHHILTVWPTSNASVVAAMHDLAAASTTDVLTLPATATSTPVETPLSDTVGRQVALGAVLADVTTGHLMYIGAGVRASSVVPGHVYAMGATQNVLDIDVTGPKALTTDTQHIDTAVPVGLVTSTGQEQALVAADKVDQHLLYALPAG